jgi:RNA-directed DNA polymerase
MDSVVRFLEGKLRLRVNRQKSAVAPVGKRKFLSHRLLLNGKLGLAPKSLERAKQRIRQNTRRNRGLSLVQVIQELNSFLTGWLNYFRYAACRAELQRLDGWIRRKLRTYRLNNANAVNPLLPFFSNWGHPQTKPGGSLLPGKVGGVWLTAPQRSAPWITSGSQPRAWYPC